jgi:TM2 domain-containing membrane protein YozV
MKPFVPRPNRKTVNRTAARNAALVNQFATPGLGSLMAGRWLAGVGQLLLAVAGFVLVIVWFFETIVRLYDQIDNSPALHSVARIGETGAALFVIAWFWALVTSISLVMRAKSAEPAAPQTVPPPTANPPAEPPKLFE